MSEKLLLKMFSIVAFVLFISACNDVNKPADINKNRRHNDLLSEFSNKIKSQEDKLSGIIEARCMKINTGNSINYYQVSADIYKVFATNNKINVGKVKISDFDINTPDTSNTYFYDFPSAATNIPKFGSLGRFSIEGNESLGIPAFDTLLYVPSELVINNAFTDDQLSRNKALTLKWNKENNKNLDCHLFLAYHAKNDTSITWYKKIPDTGNFTIGKEILQRFPPGAEIDFFLSRGNGFVLKKNNKKFLLFGYSFCWLLLKMI